MSSTIIQNILYADDVVAMIVSDEVEAVARTKVRLTISFLYANLCIKEIFKNFYCEGCENGWPSQRDHMCAIQSEQEIIEDGYDDIAIDLDVLKELCEQFLKLADLPMTEEWEVFINKLPLSSALGTLLFWRDFSSTCEPEEQIIVDFVRMITKVLLKEQDWDSEPYLEFRHLMWQ